MQKPKHAPSKKPARPRLSRTTTAQAAQSSSRFMTSREKKRAAKGSESLVPGPSRSK
jgi:hypothetical protein